MSPLNSENKKGHPHVNMGGCFGKKPKEGGTDFKAVLQAYKLLRYSNLSTRILLSVGILASSLQGIVVPIFMVLVGELAYNIWDIDSLLSLVYILLYIALATLFVSAAATYSMEYVAHVQANLIKEAYFKALLRQEMAWYDSADPNTLTSSVEDNMVLIRDALGMKLSQIIMFISLFIGAVVVALVRCWQLALAMMACMPVVTGGIAVFSIALMTRTHRSKIAYDKAGGIAEEMLLLHRIIKAFGCEEIVRGWFSKETNVAESEGIKGALYSSLGVAILFPALFCQYAVGFVYSGRLVSWSLEESLLTGEPPKITVSHTLGALLSMVVTSVMLGHLVPMLTSFVKGIQAAMDLYTIIDRVSPLDPFDEAGKKPEKRGGEIKFENVSFSYPTRPDKPVFTNLNITIKEGETVAFVGPSGAGKSTILQLLQRFYDVDSGAITMNGTPLTELNLAYLRDLYAVVSQNPRLLGMSIRGNIQMACSRELSEEEMERSLKLAHALDFVQQFPQGLDTNVGEGGGQLSGGQKQRIAITRAFARNSPIIILDEATSSLDVKSEKYVQDAINDLLSAFHRTTIIVAHRLSTVRNADKIFVFGRKGDSYSIVQQGTHEELIQEEDGQYSKMMKAQTFITNDEVYAEDATDTEGSEATTTRVDIPDEPLEVMVKTPAKLEESSKQERKRLLSKNGMKHKKIGIAKMMTQKFWIYCALGSFASLIVGCVFPSIGLMLAQYVYVLIGPIPQDIRDETEVLSLIFVGLAGVIFLASFAQNFFFQTAGQFILKDVRRMLFSKLIYADTALLDDPKHSPGYLASMLSADVTLINMGYTANTPVLIQLLSTIVVAIAISAVADYRIVLCLFALAALMSVGAIVRRKSMSVSGGSGQPNESNSAVFLLNEVVTNISSVTSYGMQNMLLKTYGDRLRIEERIHQKEALKFGIAWGISQGGSFAVNALSFYFGGLTLQSAPNDTNFWLIIQAIFAVMFAARGVGYAVIFSSDKAAANVAEDRIASILRYETKLDASKETGLKEHAIFDEELTYKNVNFQYEQRKGLEIYENLSLEVKPGYTVAIVGESGCGKSTIIHLLERFYDISGTASSSAALPSDGKFIRQFTSEDAQPAGRIALGDVNIKDLNLSFLRSKLGLVSQEPYLFGGSIIENIKIGKPNATFEEVKEAARMANAAGFIELFPEKYDTQVGNLGLKISGGQRQRIAIARALIRSPKILLLDEATSALDSESEKIVQDALDALTTGGKYTTIVVAHRLSTIRNADKIFVLRKSANKGSAVIESGNHDELMRIEGGHYRSLINAS